MFTYLFTCLFTSCLFVCLLAVYSFVYFASLFTVVYSLFTYCLLVCLLQLNFQKERIFSCLWRILIDTTQPLSVRGKQSYCEFLKTITNHADGTDFSVSQESTKAFESLVRMAQDTKPELSRCSKATLQALFQLNCATFSSLADTMPRGDRELLTTLMRDATESPTEVEEFSPNSNLAIDQLLRGMSDTF